MTPDPLTRFQFPVRIVIPRRSETRAAGSRVAVMTLGSGTPAVAESPDPASRVRGWEAADTWGLPSIDDVITLGVRRNGVGFRRERSRRVRRCELFSARRVLSRRVVFRPVLAGADGAPRLVFIGGATTGRRGLQGAILTCETARRDELHDAASLSDRGIRRRLPPHCRQAREQFDRAAGCLDAVSLPRGVRQR